MTDILADWDSIPVQKQPQQSSQPQQKQQPADILADWDSIPTTSSKVPPLRISHARPNSPDSMVGRLASGAALGVADLGNTVLNAVTAPVGKVIPAVAQWNRTRNADFEALTDANKDSTAFNVGRVGGNVGITLPVGGALAGGVRAAAPILGRLGVSAPAVEALANSVASGGMRTGGATTGLANMATRAAGGAITGGASAAAVNPDNAGPGAVIGAALPGFVKTMGAVGSKIDQAASSAAESLMQSAIKPTIKQLKNGEAATAIRTLLDYGISPNMAGVAKLRDLIGGLNDQIADQIANSTATIKKSDVMTRLSDIGKTFSNQVSPSADLAAIQRVGDDFANHPVYPGDDLAVQAAQALKQGTYKTLAKKYGQMGGAETEAQKGLARGLKEEIANAVPEVAGLNAEESKLLTTLSVAERRALMELNKNPQGLAALATDPRQWARFMLDRSSAFKALAARMINSSGGFAGGAAPALQSGFSNPLIRGAAVNSISSSER
jgi:hypothetical protein